MSNRNTNAFEDETKDDLSLYAIEYITNAALSVVTLRFSPTPYEHAQVFQVEMPYSVSEEDRHRPQWTTTESYQIDLRKIGSLHAAVTRQSHREHAKQLKKHVRPAPPSEVLFKTMRRRLSESPQHAGIVLLVLSLLILCLANGCAPGAKNIASVSSSEKLSGEKGESSYSNITNNKSDVADPLVAKGIVHLPDGAVCPDANVSAILTGRGKGTQRTCIYTTTDSGGSYRIHGQPNVGPSLFWAEANGLLGVSYAPERINLRDGEIVVHVRDASCRAMENVVVAPYLSGIEDMSFLIPANIRKELERITDTRGTVRYPSRLGDYDLGFEVRISEVQVLRRSSYSGLCDCKHKLFVVTDERNDIRNCRQQLSAELALTPHAATVLESGRQEPDY